MELSILRYSLDDLEPCVEYVGTIFGVVYDVQHAPVS